MSKHDKQALKMLIVGVLMIVGLLAYGVCGYGPPGGSGFDKGFTGGGVGGTVILPATIVLGPMRMPAMNIPGWLGGIWGWIGGLFTGSAGGTLVDCVIGPTGGCTTASGGVGGGGGGGWPPCNTCNMSGPPGTTPGGGGGWVRKMNLWNWFEMNKEGR